MGPMTSPLASTFAAPVSSEQGRGVLPQVRRADKRGLECCHCGSKHFWVIYTRATWGGRIMRRRECRHCGKRLTTWEKAGA